MIATLALATLLASGSPACDQLKQIIEEEAAIYFQCQQEPAHPAELSCSKARDDMEANMVAYGKFCGPVGNQG